MVQYSYELWHWFRLSDPASKIYLIDVLQVEAFFFFLLFFLQVEAHYLKEEMLTVNEELKTKCQEFTKLEEEFRFIISFNNL